ncbi:uncharacterized protein [Callorhinus ursinus]|uniref:uncharacterized protein n=1 Tax=Callorhinus ursinus TaxID=34884 RepID=UPI003CD01C8B
MTLAVAVVGLQTRPHRKDPAKVTRRHAAGPGSLAAAVSASARVVAGAGCTVTGAGPARAPGLTGPLVDLLGSRYAAPRWQDWHFAPHPAAPLALPHYTGRDSSGIPVIPPRAGAAAGGGAAEGRAEGGPGRGAVREAGRPGAGRVRPPGAAGRAAFLMCHQHVELARAAQESERAELPQLSRGLAAPFPAAPGSRSLGRGAAAAPRSGQVERGPGSRPGPRAGHPGRRGAGPGSQLLPRPPAAATRARRCGKARPTVGGTPPAAQPRPCAPTDLSADGVELWTRGGRCLPGPASLVAVGICVDRCIQAPGQPCPGALGPPLTEEAQTHKLPSPEKMAVCRTLTA